MELKYDHPNFPAAVAVLAERSEHTDEEVLDAVATISSMIESERDVDAQDWNDWVENGTWEIGFTVEETLQEVDEIIAVMRG